MQSKGEQAGSGWRGHADGEQIDLAVEVQVGEGVSHPEEMPMMVEGGGAVDERALAIVVINIQAGKIADVDEVERAIVIEIDEGGAVGASEAFRVETG